jgi:hypothetical protein
VFDPVVDHEGCSGGDELVEGSEVIVVEGGGRRGRGGLPDFLKVAVVKNEEILVLVAQTLDVVRDTLGEVPDVALFKLLGCPAAVLVDGGEEEGALVDEAPFSLHVISKLPRQQVVDNKWMFGHVQHDASEAHG